MATNGKMAIWVSAVAPVEVAGEYLVSGIGFDSDFGFGSEEARSFKGEALFLNKEARLFQSTEVMRAHTPGENLSYTVVANKLLNVPFLMASDIQLKVIFDGKITFDPTEDGLDVLQKHGTFPEFPVGGNEWIGVFRFEDKNRGRLIAFSSTLGELPLGTVYFNDWGCPLGTVHKI